MYFNHPSFVNNFFNSQVGISGVVPGMYWKPHNDSTSWMGDLLPSLCGSRGTSGDDNTAQDLWRRGISCLMVAGHLRPSCTFILVKLPLQLTFTLGLWNVIQSCSKLLWSNCIVLMVTALTKLNKMKFYFKIKWVYFNLNLSQIQYRNKGDF